MERNRYIKAQIESQVCSSLAEINSNFTDIIVKYNSEQMDPSNALQLFKNLISMLGDLEQVCTNSDIKVYSISNIKSQIYQAVDCVKNIETISIGE